MRTIIVEVPDDRCKGCRLWILTLGHRYRCPFGHSNVIHIEDFKPTKPCRDAEVGK